MSLVILISHRLDDLSLTYEEGSVHSYQIKNQTGYRVDIIGEGEKQIWQS